MILWLDAQLPPAIGPWLGSKFGVTVQSLRDLGLRDAEDVDIFDAARLAIAVVVTKDKDFVDLVQRKGSPPQIIWLRCGNPSNTALRELFKQTFEEVRLRLEGGEQIVEVGATS